MVDGEWHSWENLTMQDTEAQDAMAAQKEAFAILSERCECWRKLARLRGEALACHHRGLYPPVELRKEMRELQFQLGEEA